MALKKESVLAVMMPKLKTTDLSPMIKLAGQMLPRIFDNCLKLLDAKERGAIDKVMPKGGEKKIYMQLVGTPTPPIVIGMAQPIKISTMPEKDIIQQKIDGIKLSTDDLQLLLDGLNIANMRKLFMSLKGQIPTMLRMSMMFMPMLRLGPKGLKNMGNKLTAQFKPLLDIFARLK